MLCKFPIESSSARGLTKASICAPVESEAASRSRLTSLKLSVSLIAGVPIVKTGFSATRNKKKIFYYFRLTDSSSREANLRVRELTLNCASLAVPHGKQQQTVCELPKKAIIIKSINFSVSMLSEVIITSYLNWHLALFYDFAPSSRRHEAPGKCIRTSSFVDNKKFLATVGVCCVYVTEIISSILVAQLKLNLIFIA